MDGQTIRVLHTESSMNLGGQELRILLEMEGLKEKGYSSLLAARPGSMILDEAGKRGLEAYAVKMHGSLDPAAVGAFTAIISRGKVDLLNAHGSKDGWSAGIAARLLGKRIVRSRHVANPIRGSFFGRLVYGPLCDRIITTSESIRLGMVEKGVDASKIVSVPTGVDMARFNPGVPKGAFRAGLGIPAEARIVGMVSVMRGDKGPDVFLKAAESLLPERPDVYFALVGDGWMLPKLKDTAAHSMYPDRIILTGYRKDVPAVLADLDVFVLPALVPEGVPQAVLQAHAMKVPVVASEVGGISEVAIDQKTAVTVTPGNDTELAKAISGLLDGRENAAALAEAGYALVKERYTLEGMLETMDRIYRETLAGVTRA